MHSVPFSEIEGMEPWLASETIFMESKSMENQIFIKNEYDPVTDSTAFFIDDEYTVADIVHNIDGNMVEYSNVEIEYVYDGTVLVKLFCNTLFDKYLTVTSLHRC